MKGNGRTVTKCLIQTLLKKNTSKVRTVEQGIDEFKKNVENLEHEKAMLLARDGEWQNLVKRSDDLAKATDPGILQVRRYYNESLLEADVIYDLRWGPI